LTRKSKKGKEKIKNGRKKVTLNIMSQLSLVSVENKENRD